MLIKEIKQIRSSVTDAIFNLLNYKYDFIIKQWKVVHCTNKSGNKI